VRRKRGERAAAVSYEITGGATTAALQGGRLAVGEGKKGREGKGGGQGRERTHSKMLRVTFCPITYDQMWKKKNKANTRNIMLP